MIASTGAATRNSRRQASFTWLREGRARSFSRALPAVATSRKRTTAASRKAQAARQARSDGPIAASSRSTAAARATRKPFTRRKGLNQLGL